MLNTFSLDNHCLSQSYMKVDMAASTALQDKTASIMLSAFSKYIGFGGALIYKGMSILLVVCFFQLKNRFLVSLVLVSL